MDRMNARSENLEFILYQFRQETGSISCKVDSGKRRVQSLAR